mgnify:CR=1 FL=1
MMDGLFYLIYLRMDLDLFREEAARSLENHKMVIKKLRKSKNVDDQFHSLHDEVFQEIDCLECANCCKTTSPIFQETDIQRLSKSLKMKVSEFIDSYLQLDEENDYVLTQAPCPFLGLDNKCIVYDSRPKACREYPHTNRKRMRQILNLTLKNTQVCPAVHQIMKRIDLD